jgi:hypothetical protein
MRDGGSLTETDAIRDAFSLLAHDIRLDIVLALLDNWAAVHTEPQSYSALMSAVGMEDSGKFNYHLDRLLGVYVAKVEDGYVPTASATALYRAVLAHRPTASADRTAELDTPCPHCGGTLIEEYERSFFTLDCTDCDGWEGMTYPFPQNGLRDWTGADRFHAVTRRAAHHIGLAQTGQCPYCAGHVAVALDPDWAEGTEPAVTMACETCSWTVGVSVLTAVQFVPRVAGALLVIGLERPFPEQRLTDLVTDSTRSSDPPRIELTVETAEGAVTITVDDDLSVVSVEEDISTT